MKVKERSMIMDEFKLTFGQPVENVQEKELTIEEYALTPYLKKSMSALISDSEYMDYLTSQYIDNSGREEVGEKIRSLHEKMVVALYNIRKTVANAQVVNILKRTASQKCLSNVTVTFSQVDKIGHLVFSDLLPKRIHRGYENSDMVWNDFCEPLFALLKEIEYERYDEKVVLFFKHIYRSKSELKDHDNLVDKPLIDGITISFLKDDNPLYMARYADFEIGDYTHTEVFIIPESRFVDFLIHKSNI